jgi:hypothetical protein
MKAIKRYHTYLTFLPAVLLNALHHYFQHIIITNHMAA